jgi:hypothetical protein
MSDRSLTKAFLVLGGGLLGVYGCQTDTVDGLGSTEQSIIDGTVGGNHVDFVLGSAVTRDRDHGGGPGLRPNCNGTVAYIPGQPYNAELGSTELDLANTASHCAGAHADSLVFQKWKIDGKKVRVSVGGWKRSTADLTKMGTLGDYMNAAICPALFRTVQMWKYPAARSLGAVRNQRGYRHYRLVENREVVQDDDRTDIFTRDGYPFREKSTLVYKMWDGTGRDANPLVIGNSGDSGGGVSDVEADELVGIHHGRSGNPPTGHSLGTWITRDYALAVRNETLTELEGDETSFDGTDSVEPESSYPEAEAEDPRTTAIGNVKPLGCYKITLGQAANASNIDKIRTTAQVAGTIGKIPPGAPNPLVDNSAPRNSYPAIAPDATVTFQADVKRGCTFDRWTFGGVAGAGCVGGNNAVNPCDVKFPVDAGGELTVRASATCPCKESETSAIGTGCVPDPDPIPDPIPDPDPVPDPVPLPTPTPIPLPDPQPLPLPPPNLPPADVAHK